MFLRHSVVVVAAAAVAVLLLLLLCPGRGSVYCDQSVCLSVCLSVREHKLISGTAGPIFTKCFMQISAVAVARFSSGGCAIRYVVPVLWMTSRLTVW